MRVLVIEDESKVARFVARGLTAERFAVDAAPDARDYFINQATPEGIAFTLTDEASRLLKGKGEFAIVTGTLSNDKCYIRGVGVTRVDFFLDSTPIGSDTVMADGMSCMLDTTKFANGAHTLKAVARNSAGATYNEVVAINIANTVSTR